MAPDADGIVNRVDQDRRNFLRTLIAGAAFAPPLIASFSLDGLSLAAAGEVVSNQCVEASNQCGPVEYFTDFCGSAYEDDFRDVLRGGDINSGTDLAGGGHPSLNFTGAAGAGGSTWLTVLDWGPLYGAVVCLSADVLIHRYNNSKGAGLVALYNEGTGKKALALVIINAGNTDTLQLGTVDQAGKFTKLKSVALGSGIQENAWYRLTMQVVTEEPNGESLTLASSGLFVTGRVFRHSTPTDPDSDCPTQVGATLEYGPTAFPSGVDPFGEVGIAARATSAIVDSSVTNFSVSAESVPV